MASRIMLGSPTGNVLSYQRLALMVCAFTCARPRWFSCIARTSSHVEAAAQRPSSVIPAFTVHKSFEEIAGKYDAFILDQFGVMHNGQNALEGARGCVNQLKSSGKSLIILSNTSARSSTAISKLPKFGFDPSDFVGAVTSGEESSKYIMRQYGKVAEARNRPSRAVWFTWDVASNGETGQNNP